MVLALPRGVGSNPAPPKRINHRCDAIEKPHEVSEQVVGTNLGTGTRETDPVGI